MPTGDPGIARRPRRSWLAQLTLTAEDRATLERWTTRRKTAHGLAVRAEIVLRCSEGCSNTQVARELRLTNTTVGKWRSRFVAGGVAALLDEPRSGTPRRITDDQVEAVVVRTLESTPRDATHWTCSLDGCRNRHDSSKCASDLESVRSSTAPHRHLQTVDGS